ncbi:hypothetical protein ACA29_09485 [Lederbergia galactosidilytica]|uniref:Uncharacterized protein n=1 Tax=Lederbergia galactosidilytica TaxID=217031 RepID=A0A0Q9Y9P7_9BACI|nr:hypothetical protein ACA29_09485 [Lederbergia galactosidilytica]
MREPFAEKNESERAELGKSGIHFDKTFSKWIFFGVSDGIRVIVRINKEWEVLSEYSNKQIDYIIESISSLLMNEQYTNVLL